MLREGRVSASMFCGAFMPSKPPLSVFVIGVLIVWGLILAIGYVVRGPTIGHPMLHVCGGFLLGMLAMYIATRVYQVRSPR
jgi:hypothetical protein